jgi:hypothetical protein
MKSFVGNIIGKVIKATPRKKKVSPDIKSVKPNLKKSGKESRSDEYRKRYQALDKAEDKVKSGKQMMKEGQKERKHMVDTGRAFQFKGGSRHAVNPGENPKVKYKGLLKEEKKANGGRIGRKFGGPMKKKTNIEKIRETFAPKNKNLKPVDKKKNPGLAKLPTKVRNNMGYMKSGGRAGFKGGGADMSKISETENTSKDKSRKIGSNVYRRKP